MNSASFSIDHDFHPALVRGYDTDGVTEIPYWHTLYRAFGGADLAPRDMAPFLRVLLNNGQHHRSAIFLPQSIKRMHHPHTSLAARAGLTYGYGLGIYQYQRNGFSFFGHGGDADGYLSFFAHSPQLGLGYFVTMNAFNNRALKAMRVEIERYLIGDNQPAELSEVSLDHEHLQSLTGQYQPITQRFRRKQPSRARRVIVNAGSLVVTRPDLQPLVLVPVTKWLFRQPHETVATAVFVRCGEAHVLQSDIGNFAQIPETPGTANRPCVYADTTHRTPVPPIPQ